MSGPTRAARAERWALAGMAAGVALMLQPFWEGGLRTGFFATLGFTVAQIVLSHLPERRA